MNTTQSTPPRRAGDVDPVDQPGSLPVEPDQGLVPPDIPGDPAQQRVVPPED